MKWSCFSERQTGAGMSCFYRTGRTTKEGEGDGGVVGFGCGARMG